MGNFRRSLGSCEDGEKFIRLLNQSFNPAAVYYPGVPYQFEPENRFIRFLDDDTYLGDELSPRPCPANCPVVCSN